MSGITKRPTTMLQRSANILSSSSSSAAREDVGKKRKRSCWSVITSRQHSTLQEQMLKPSITAPLSSSRATSPSGPTLVEGSKGIYATNNDSFELSVERDHTKIEAKDFGPGTMTRFSETSSELHRNSVAGEFPLRKRSLIVSESRNDDRKGCYGSKSKGPARRNARRRRKNWPKIRQVFAKRRSVDVSVGESDDDSIPMKLSATHIRMEGRSVAAPFADASVQARPEVEKDENYAGKHPQRDLCHILTFTSARIGNHFDLERHDDSAWCFPSLATNSSSSEQFKDHEKERGDDEHYAAAEVSDFTSLRPNLSPSQVEAITCIPREGTLQHYIYEQRRNQEKIPSDLPPLEQRDSSLLVFHRWIQSRIAAGWARSSIAELHGNLQKSYNKAMKLLPKALKARDRPSESTELMMLRCRLAGLWCIYAHVILEIGVEAYQEQQKAKRQQHRLGNRKLDHNEGGQQNPCKRKRPKWSNTSTALPTWDDDSKANPDLELQDVVSHAIGILQIAQNCPFVGNHKYISLALGRVLFIGCGLVKGGGWNYVLQEGKAVTTFLESKITLQSSVQNAILNCWDAMEICHGTLDAPKRHKNLSTNILAENSILFLSNYEPSRDSHLWVSNVVPKEESITAFDLGQGMKDVLELPECLKNTLNITTAVVRDCNAARAICRELNRWSRLKEKLEQRRTMTLVPHHDKSQDASTTHWLDYLVLFRTMECHSDVPRTDAKWFDLEHAAASPDETTTRVEWHW